MKFYFILLHFNNKVPEIEGKIPDISDLATKSSLTVVENKIPDISSLATKSALTVIDLLKKADFNTKITGVEGKISNDTNLVKKDRFRY